MWLPTRRWSTAFYLLMLIIVLVVAVLKQNVFLVLFLLLIEVLAGSWYALSYIPFGRKIVCACLRKTGVCMPCFYVYDSAKEQYDKNRNKDSTTSRVSRFFGGDGESERSQKGESQVWCLCQELLLHTPVHDLLVEVLQMFDWSFHVWSTIIETYPHN